MKLYRCILLYAVICADGQQYTAALSHASTSEGMLRSHVTRIIRPSYPAVDLARATTGIAVANLRVAADGNVERLTILEAPSSSIAQSVAAAVSKWKFQPWPQTVMSAKVTFYFEFKNGQGIVWYPSEAPYLGRWPSPKRNDPTKR